LRDGQVRALDSDFASLNKQLDELTGLSTGWDGYSAPTPSTSAVSDARELLRKLQGELLKPYRVSASAEGGVAFSFRASRGRRVQIELLNEGEKYAHLYDTLGNSYTHEWPQNFENAAISTLFEPILNYLRE